MHGFGKWLDARAREAPARKTKLTESAGRYLKIAAAELPKVIAVCQSAVAELREIEAQTREYWQAELQKGNVPDKARARKFEAVRQAAIQTGTDWRQGREM